MKTRVPLFVLLVGSLGAPPATATTLVRLSLEQLAQASTDIVRGHVISLESRWNSDHTQIVTLTTVAVEESMKGHPAQTVVIEQLGGTVANTRVRVAGTALFQSGASYMLFLEPSAPGSSSYNLVGMVQGSYRIYRDFATHEERLILPSSTLTTGAGKEVKTVAGAVSLREFRQFLSTALEAPVVIPRGTSMPVAIESTEPRGVARLQVVGRTTSELYPNPGVVIPADSRLEGSARLVSGTWRINWTEVSIRSARVAIHAESEEPAGGPLRGRMLVVNMR